MEGRAAPAQLVDDRLVHGARDRLGVLRVDARAPASSCPCRPCSAPRRRRRSACSPAPAPSGPRARRRRARAATAPRPRGTPPAPPRCWPKRCSPKNISTAARADALVRGRLSRPCPRRARRPSAPPGTTRTASSPSASSRVREHACTPAVGTPTSLHQLLGVALRALDARGRGASARTRGCPPSPSVSTRPSTSGASGPTTTRSHLLARARRDESPPTSSAPLEAAHPVAAMPGVAGRAEHLRALRAAHAARGRARARGRRRRPRVRERAPLTGGDELVDRDRDERLVAGGAARAELQRDAGHRLLVGRLDDVDEVVPAEHRPLRLDGRRRAARSPC